jgi:hypothetical protein
MFKKLSAIVLALCMLAAFTVTVSADDEGPLYLDPWNFGGAFLDAKGAGLTVGTAYTLTYEIETDNTTGFRVRYTEAREANPFVHNDSANNAHSTDAATAIGRTANQVPAFFGEGTIGVGNTGIITVNFVYGAAIADLDPVYMDYIGIFGFQGGADYTVHGVTLSNASGAILASVGTAPAPVGGGTPAAGGGGNAGGGGSAASDDEKHGADTGVAGIATVVGIAAVATVGVIVSVKKRK